VDEQVVDLGKLVDALVELDVAEDTAGCAAAAISSRE
jgi:hypothetical protein